jgi:pimeloyl-ACP methyl ester carboxylesterase
VQKELNDKLDVFEILYNKKGSVNSLIGTGASMANLKSFYDFLSNYDIEKNIMEHVVPTLIIHGEKDCVISQKDVDKLSKILNGKKMIIYNEGHFIPLTATKQFNEILLDFIFRIKSKEGNTTN